jgi:hypothetical protein
MTTPTTPLNQQRRPKNYQDALAAAAAVHATKPTALTPVPVLLRTSEQIIGKRDQVSVWAKRVIGALWASVNPYSDSAVTDFATQAAQVMASAQAVAGRVAAAGQAQQLQSVGINIGTPTPSLPVDIRAPGATIADGSVSLHRKSVTVDYVNDDTARITPSDMSTQSVFERPAETYRYTSSTGVSPEAARNAALTRIGTLVDDNLMLTQRLSQQEVIAQAVDLDKPGPKIIGYRRVIHPELSRTGTCGLCIAASDRIYKWSKLMPLHSNCRCSIAAVTEEHDPAADTNAVDLSKVYGHAGGNTASHLKRTRYQIDDHGELGPVLVPKRR